jgi:hypothetical protein
MAENTKPANLLRRRHWWSDFLTPETPRLRLTLAVGATLLGLWCLVFKAYGRGLVFWAILAGCLAREAWYRWRGRNVDRA